jgi:hypothetical protein
MCWGLVWQFGGTALKTGCVNNVINVSWSQNRSSTCSTNSIKQVSPTFSVTYKARSEQTGYGFPVGGLVAHKPDLHRLHSAAPWHLDSRRPSLGQDATPSRIRHQVRLHSAIANTRCLVPWPWVVTTQENIWYVARNCWTRCWGCVWKLKGQPCKQVLFIMFVMSFAHNACLQHVPQSVWSTRPKHKFSTFAVSLEGIWEETTHVSNMSQNFHTCS